MKHTFIHRSEILGARVDVDFKKGKLPSPTFVHVLYVDLSEREAAQIEFGKWIDYVFDTLEEAGAKVKRQIKVV